MNREDQINYIKRLPVSQALIQNILETEFYQKSKKLPPSESNSAVEVSKKRKLQSDSIDFLEVL
jgi:hypothetical protein